MNYQKRLFKILSISTILIFAIAAKPSHQFLKAEQSLIKEIKANARTSQAIKPMKAWQQKKKNAHFSNLLETFVHSFPLEQNQWDDRLLAHSGGVLTEQALAEFTHWDKIIGFLISKSEVCFEDFSPTHLRLIREKKRQFLNEKRSIIEKEIAKSKKELEKKFTTFIDMELEQASESLGELQSIADFIEQVCDSDTEHADCEEAEIIEDYLHTRSQTIQAQALELGHALWQEYILAFQEDEGSNLIGFEEFSKNLEQIYISKFVEQLHSYFNTCLEPMSETLRKNAKRAHKTVAYRGAAAYLRKQLQIYPGPASETAAYKLSHSGTCLACQDQVVQCVQNPFKCSHSYCKECTAHLIESREHAMEPLACPVPRCSASAKLDQLLASQVISSYLHALFNFIEVREIANTSPAWLPCKKPDCEGGIIRPALSENTRFSCELCNYNQCMNCKEDHNQYVSCSEYKEIQDHRDDPLYLSRKKKLIKDCPKCRIPISKAEGCLHMTCKKCKHEFNWETLTPWEGKDFYRQTDGSLINPDVDSGREMLEQIE